MVSAVARTVEPQKSAVHIHYHSDCAFFSGSESMLANFFGSPRLRSSCTVSFSYRATERYEQGLRQRATLDFPIYPLELPDADAGLAGGRWTRALAIAWRQLSYYPLFIGEVWTLSRLLRKLRPDVLHINNGGYPGALSCRAMALAGKLAGVQHIVMMVNNLAVGYGRPSRWMDYPVDRLVRAAVDRFVTGSTAAGGRLAKVLGLESKRARAIHNGIRKRPTTASVEQTRSRLGIAKFEGTVFGIVALLEPRKGHATLIEAAARVAKAAEAGAGIKVLIEGHGPLQQVLAADIAKRGLSEVVELVGDEAQIFDFMAGLDVLVLSSLRDEDFPNVILEAMSLGRPVIASRLAGTPEQVEDGVSGILVEPGNADELALAINRLAHDAELRRRMGEAALAQFEAKFTSEAAVKSYIGLYSELTGTNLESAAP